MKSPDGNNSLNPGTWLAAEPQARQVGLILAGSREEWGLCAMVAAVRGQGKGPQSLQERQGQAHEQAQQQEAKGHGDLHEVEDGCAEPA